MYLLIQVKKLIINRDKNNTIQKLNGLRLMKTICISIIYFKKLKLFYDCQIRRLGKEHKIKSCLYEIQASYIILNWMSGFKFESIRKEN